MTTKHKAKTAPNQDDAAQRDSSYYDSPEFIERLRKQREHERARPWLKDHIPWSARDIRNGRATGEAKYDPFEHARADRLDAWFAVMEDIDRTADPEELLALSIDHLHAFRAERARRWKKEGKSERKVIAPREVGWIAASKTKPRPWLYAPHYLRGFMSSTVAPGGIGKTSLGLVESLAMLTHRDILGIMPHEDEPLNVWYWNGEDPQDEMERRWAAVLKHYGIKPKDLKGRFYMDSGRELPIKIAKIGKDGDIRIAIPTRDALIDAIRDRGIDVIHIDPFVSSHIVPENSNEHMQQVAEQWAHIANVTGCCVILWHHSRKTGGRQVEFEDGRGASAIGDAARGRRVLNKMTPDEARKAGVDPSQCGRYFWADHTGTSMIPPAEAREWYRLESVNLMNGEDGLDGDSVGVVTRWEYIGAAGLDATPEQQAAIIEAVRAGQPWRMDVQAKDWIGHAFAGVLGLDPKDKKDRITLKATVEDWIADGLLEEYQDRHPTRNNRQVDFVRLSADAEFD